MTKSLLPALIWLVLITVLSTSPATALPKFDLFSIDKVEHAAAYGLLAWLILYGIKKANLERSLSGVKVKIGVFLFATTYGVLMEYAQYFFSPGRQFDTNDMLANAFGAAVVSFLVTKVLALAP